MESVQKNLGNREGRGGVVLGHTRTSLGSERARTHTHTHPYSVYASRVVYSASSPVPCVGVGLLCVHPPHSSKLCAPPPLPNLCGPALFPSPCLICVGLLCPPPLCLIHVCLLCVHPPHSTLCACWRPGSAHAAASPRQESRGHVQGWMAAAHGLHGPRWRPVWRQAEVTSIPMRPYGHLAMRG